MKTAGRGASYTYTWDGKDSGGNLVGKGIYLYQVTARQLAQDDSDSDKSAWSITHTSADITGYDENTGVATVQVEFMVGEPPPPDPPMYLSSAKVEVFDPDLDIVAGAEASSDLPVGEMIYFPELSVHFDKGGTYIFLVSAWDQGGVLDFHMNRNHGPKPLLQQNGRIYVKKVLVLVDPGHGGSAPGTPGHKWPEYNRYTSWDEREMNGWMANCVQAALTQHTGTPYCNFKIYEVRINPVRVSDQSKRADWANDQVRDAKPAHAAFVSLHCNGGSWTNRSTIVFYRPDIVDSSTMANSLRNQLSSLDSEFGVNRAYGTADATGGENMGLLEACANARKRKYTCQAACNLLEMVMLTEEHDEDWIYTQEVRDAMADRIHRAYCNFTFQPIDYD